MKKMWFVIIVSVISTLLLIGCVSPIEPPVEENVKRIIGTWLNVDQETQQITKIYIAEVSNYLSIEEWGKCHPEDCYWEKKLVKKNEIIDGVMEVSWTYVEFEVYQEIVLLDDPNGRLKVTTIFSYPSGYQWSIIDDMFKLHK